MEESGELFEGIAKDKSELIYDALGDIQVVLIGLGSTDQEWCSDFSKSTGT